MNAMLSPLRWSFVAGGLAVAVPFSGFGSDQALIKVFPDHYAAGAARFASLETLEALVKPMSGAVQLHSCGLASTQQLLAAVERLQHVHVRELRIRTLAADDAGCSSALGVFVRSDSAYGVVDQHGRSLLP